MGINRGRTKLEGNYVDSDSLLKKYCKDFPSPHTSFVITDSHRENIKSTETKSTNFMDFDIQVLKITSSYPVNSFHFHGQKMESKHTLIY